MERTIEYKIDSDADGLRIEQYLRHKGYSYQNLTQLKKMPESILINGVWSYMRSSLAEGDLLTVHIQENESSESSKAKLDAMGLKAEVEASAQNTIKANGKEYAHTNANTVVGTKASSEALDQALQAQVATDASKWQKLSAQDEKATATNENLAVLTSEDPTMPTEGKLDPSQILTSKKHALTTSANVKVEVSVEARDALKEAHKAGLKVVSSSYFLRLPS